MRPKSGLEQILNRCKNFTGIQHDCCKANISYERFRKPNGALVPLPCHRDDKSPDVCESAEWHTREEAEVIEGEHQKAIAEYFEAIEKGHCHLCKKPVKQHQVGHCVYGSCGHRLYQGTVNPEFAEKP